MTVITEPELISRLTAVAPSLRAAFAAGCAQRISNAWARIGPPGKNLEVVRDMLSVMWTQLKGGSLQEHLRKQAVELLDAIPVDDAGIEIGWVEPDSMAATIYAVESFWDVQSAAFAARRPVEAIDTAGEVGVVQPDHGVIRFVRREQERQLRDLDISERASHKRIISSAVDQLHSYATTETVF